jgi:hypothetical protein
MIKLQIKEKEGDIWITIKKASMNHVEGICKVCSDGYRATDKELYPQSYIEKYRTKDVCK